MNSIYKVIWSKAKNCYVVASEIARSHTKSASGSEKIGGGTRRKLLASLMALSLLCGGLGVANAEEGTVDVQDIEATATSQKVYTAGKVDALLAEYGKKTDVENNQNNIKNLQNTTTAQGQSIATNVANIANNTKAIEKKIDTDTANERFATKDALRDLQSEVTGKVDENTFEDALDEKADKTYVDTKLDGKADKATTLDGYGIKDAYTTTAADAKFATSDALYTAKTDLEGKITANTTKIDANKTEIDGLKTKAGTTETALTGLSGRMTTAETEIMNLKDADVRLEGKIDANEKAIDKNKDDITQNKNDITSINEKLTTAEGNITANKNAIDDLKTNVGTVNNGTYLDSSKTVGENLNKLNDGLVQEVKDRTAADDALSGRINANAKEIARVNHEVEDTNNHFNAELRKTNAALQEEGKVRANADAALAKDIKATNKRTAGIGRTDTGVEAGNQTVIESKVYFDQNGNVSGVKDLQTDTIHATGEITSGGLDAKAGDIKTTGKVSAGDISTGTLETTGNATIGGNLDVTGTLNIKDVTAETINISKSENTTEYKSKGSIIGDGGKLSVSNEKTYNRTNITKESQLNVNEEGTVNWATSKDNETGNVTAGRSEVTADNIKNSVKKTEGGKTFGYEENITAGGKGGTVTDKAGNTTYTKVTATENSFQVQDKDGNKNHQVNTKDSSKTEITNADGKTTTTEQTATDITNTAKDGTITNDAQNIVNTATTMKTTVTGKATESYGELETTVTGQATEKFNGGLDTTVTGAENHTVTGKQTNTVGGGQINNITGGQINNITGNQTTIVTNGNISNTADNITNEAKTQLTDKVGTNTRVTTSTSITDTVGTKTNRKIEDGKITDTAGDFTVTTDKANGTTFAKTGSATYSTEARAPTDTNIAGNLIKTGRVDANELGVSDKDGDNTANLTVQAGEDGGVKASAGNGTTTGSLDVKADEVGSSVTDASGKGSTFKQRIDAIMMESKNVSINAEETLTNEAKDIVTNASNSITEKVGDTNVTKKTTTSSKSEIQNADTITSVQQTENMVQSYVGKKDFSVTNVTTNFANASANQVTENGQTSTVLNNKDGLLIQNNANGNSFTTADGTNTGPALEWTNIKGNEISTGKVEANYVKMGYADVMKDLGVHGNAKVGQNLEVGGTSMLKGDVTMGSNATVEKDLNVKGTTTTKTLNVTGNATVGGTLDVTQRATFHDAVDIAKDLSVGGNVTAKSYKVGDKTYIDANGIHANNQKITNVADGSISEGSKDAVNGGQLYGMKMDLEHKVDKVGANAAAMANLHPMEFDPDSKWNIAAAMGNYGSETATAIGAFYRPNEDVMVNFSTAFGTGENMVGGGVSVRLGKGSNKLSREESNALKDQVNDLTARMDALLSVLNPNMSKDFPDVPENHWAYEAVSRLAGNDIVQGYPDGEFHGERTMTRYEMAEIIYNALSRGAEAERELVEEFKPELQAMAASEKATAERAEG